MPTRKPRGADLLRASVADTFGGCVAISIDGHGAGQRCNPDEQ